MAEFGKWLPMETCPRDSTPILLFLEAPSAQPVGVGSAPVTQIIIGDMWGPGNEMVSVLGDVVRVIRWMPLPPHPED